MSNRQKDEFAASLLVKSSFSMDVHSGSFWIDRVATIYFASPSENRLFEEYYPSRTYTDCGIDKALTLADPIKAAVRSRLEKLGLVFAVRIKLKKNSLWVDGNKMNLTSGMTVTTEIKTTQRRAIEYFLDPLKCHVSESLDEC